jgi:perosamine synthetase
VRPAHARLEEAFAEFCGVEHVVAAASGTASLHLSLESLRLPPGSEVVCCDMNMVAVPRAIALAGLTPVFVDCDDRLNIDPDLVDEALSSGDVRAVIITHLYGRKARVGEVLTLTGKYSPCAVVEDLAEAHAVRPHPLSDAACWSLRKNKEIAAEEGGAVAFRDRGCAVCARRLRNMGFDDAHTFTHLPRCHNYRLADTLAGQALASLDAFGVNQALRRKAEGQYAAFCPDGWRTPPRESPWVYDLRVPGLTRGRQQAVVKALNAAGIEARMSFAPMSRQEEFRGCHLYGGEKARRAADEAFYLPLAGVTEESARLAFGIVKEALAGSALPGA